MLALASPLSAAEPARKPPPPPPPPAPPVAPPPAARTRGTREALVVAVDLEPVAPLPGVAVVRGDFAHANVRAEVRALLAAGGGAAHADVVLSDMAHAFTGAGSLDGTRQMALAWRALLFAARVLPSLPAPAGLASAACAGVTGRGSSRRSRGSSRRGGGGGGGDGGGGGGGGGGLPRGVFVCKVRHSDEYAVYRAALRGAFSAVSEAKPPASRAGSAETYFVCRGFVGAAGEGALRAALGVAALECLEAHGLAVGDSDGEAET